MLLLHLMSLPRGGRQGRLKGRPGDFTVSRSLGSCRHIPEGRGAGASSSCRRASRNFPDGASAMVQSLPRRRPGTSLPPSGTYRAFPSYTLITLSLDELHQVCHPQLEPDHLFHQLLNDKADFLFDDLPEAFNRYLRQLPG